MASSTFDFDESIASGLQRNPNLTILDTKSTLFPLSASSSQLATISASGWLQNVAFNAKDDPELNDRLKGPRDPEWWYTGIKPEASLWHANGRLSPLPHPDLTQVTRAQAIEYFQHSWLFTEILFGALQGLEAFYRPPYHNQRHPLIFYYVHPAVLFVNKFRLAGLISDPIDQEIEILFESGVDSMTWDDLSKNDNLWPPFRRCIDYRRKSYEALLSVISSHEAFDSPTGSVKIGPSSPMWALFLGIAHEAIHVETSSVLFRELNLALLLRPALWPAYDESFRTINPEDPSTFPKLTLPAAGTQFPNNDFVAVSAQTLQMGRAESQTRVFGWDNEFGSAEIDVPPFSVSRFPTTNGEFYEFVASGDYVKDKYWSPVGRAWRSSRNIKAPTFWVAIGPQGLQDYALRVIFDVVAMPWSAPVCVNFHEAQAYASWKAEKTGLPIRITTEPEMRLLRDSAFPGCKTNEEIAAHDPVLQASPPGTSNLNLLYGAETPVDKFPATPLGVYDVCGNVWQWCYDFFLPLPGFEIHRYYSDFSTPCFDRLHHIIWGGSFISTGNLANHFARYHFRPFFFQHAGFRLSYSNEGSSSDSCTEREVPTCEWLIQNHRRVGELGGARKYDYESGSDLAKYLSLHYNIPDDNSRLVSGGVPGVGYTQRIWNTIKPFLTEHNVTCGRALDLGCAVGSLCFDMAQSFDKVVGIDFSKTFIQSSIALQSGKSLSFELVEEGFISGHYQVSLDAARLEVAKRVEFEVGDACNLRDDLGSFDLITTINLLCRLPTPRKCLSTCTDLLHSNGLLVLMTPCSYSDEFSHPSEWLGGRIDPVTSKPIRTLENIQSILSPKFDLLHVGEVPLVIRLHSRKFELILSLLTIWRKK